MCMGTSPLLPFPVLVEQLEWRFRAPCQCPQSGLPELRLLAESD